MGTFVMVMCILMGYALSSLRRTLKVGQFLKELGKKQEGKMPALEALRDKIEGEEPDEATFSTLDKMHHELSRAKGELEGLGKMNYFL